MSDKTTSGTLFYFVPSWKYKFTFVRTTLYHCGGRIVH